jgi:hypothetical protein
LIGDSAGDHIVWPYLTSSIGSIFYS